ncbi:VP91 [Spodoptera littoralis nucleopolyhedrovirus]|uniref:VP91 n=1 Tax=Spodoptera littoralis nuclear polyhedrosis virus TaxID=10456 RepID=M1J4A9_NPVSL|nr:VP91 [Spodoptera littoralis nucleopolyhedrovirus]AGE89929.1 VP91 [Spodoptera littoralis nucleopolyhedrovirus]
MSTVPLLFVVIMMLILFSIIYLSIRNDFNENEFENRLTVLTEWMKRNNADMPTPETLSYVSAVNGDMYTLTEFYTNNMRTARVTVHDDTVEIFDFVNQQIIKLSTDPRDSGPRVLPDPENANGFLARGDDGWMRVACPKRERFDVDALKCVPMPPCENLPPGLYPMNESMIDELVLNHRVYRENDFEKVLYHPTLYLQCSENRSHSIHECPDGHLFNASERRCEMINPCVDRPDGFVLSGDQFYSNLDVQQYVICDNEEVSIGSCPDGAVFDRIVLACIFLHPCTFHGTNHTYITGDLAPNQFYRCVSNTVAEVVTCPIARRFVDGQYDCYGDLQCMNVENGNGSILKEFYNPVASFYTGKVVCDNYNVVSDVSCDWSNQLENFHFKNLYAVDENLTIPTRMFSEQADSCVNFDKNLMIENKSTFAIVPTFLDNNDYMIIPKFSYYGVTSQLDGLLVADATDEMPSQTVVYPNTTSGPYFIDPYTGNEIFCPGGGRKILFDVMKSFTRVNLCDENDQLVQSRDQSYYRPLRNDTVHMIDHSLGNINSTLNTEMFITKTFDVSCPPQSIGQKIFSILHQYTTKRSKYTTLDTKYTTHVEKSGVNMEKIEKRNEKVEIYSVNTRFDFVESEPVYEMSIDFDNPEEHVRALFNPFEISGGADVAPFNTLEIGGAVTDDETDTETDIETDTETDDGAADSDVLVDASQEYVYTIMYGMPLYRLTNFNYAKYGPHLTESWRSMRQNVYVHPDCANASGLIHTINSYAYLGNGIGCRCTMSENGLRIDRVSNPLEFENLELQSNDAVKYNTMFNKIGDKYMVCPNGLTDDGQDCVANPDTIITYIEDFQREDLAMTETFPPF